MIPDWKHFSFENPANEFEVRFNNLRAAKGVGAAYDYIVSAGGGQGRASLEKAWNVLGDDDAKTFYKEFLNTQAGQGNPLGLSPADLALLTQQDLPSGFVNPHRKKHWAD